mgnify:CR=1 FL=1
MQDLTLDVDPGEVVVQLTGNRRVTPTDPELSTLEPGLAREAWVLPGVGAAFFLFDYACSNRIVWGAQEFKEIRIRHTVSAPDRWLEEITPVLTEYSNALARPVEETIKAAQEKKLEDDLDAFMAKRFTSRMGTLAKAAHEREEGRPIETLWDVVTGVTAHAKTIKNQDERVALERQAGAILDLVAVK